MTIKGTFDPSFFNQKTTYGNGNSVTQNGLRNNSQGTSQVTFLGTEDLGGGLSASFLIEQDFSADTAGSWNAGGGELYTGIAGGFGSVKLGAANTPSLTAQASRQPFGTKIGGGFGGVLGTGHVRSNDSIVYASPDFSGFSAAVGYALKTKNDTNPTTPVAEVAPSTDIGLNYAAGALKAGVSFWTLNANSTAATPTGKNTQTNLYAQYDLGVAKLYAGWHSEKTKAATAGAADALRTSGYNVAVSAPMGAVTLLANYGKLNDKTAANADKKITAIGARYDLSKRTSVYGRYVAEKNSNVAATSAEKVTTLLAGIQHNF